MLCTLTEAFNAGHVAAWLKTATDPQDLAGSVAKSTDVALVMSIDLTSLTMPKNLATFDASPNQLRKSFFQIEYLLSM